MLFHPTIKQTSASKLHLGFTKSQKTKNSVSIIRIYGNSNPIKPKSHHLNGLKKADKQPIRNETEMQMYMNTSKRLAKFRII